MPQYEIQEKALELMRMEALQDGLASADLLLSRVNANERAVVGLVDTLTAVQNGRAEHVVLLAIIARSAYRFVDSGMILLELNEDSPLASGRIQELPDAVDSVIRRSLMQGIDVTMLEEHKGLQNAGSIGAFTRY